MDPSKPVLEYKNWHSITDYWSDYQLALDNGWVLYDANGNVVYEKGWPENKLMDPGHPGFKQYLVEWIGESIARGFDGVWADNSNSIYIQTAWRLSARPVNPRTGQLYTDEDWFNDHVELINHVKSIYPNYIFCSNGMLYNGYEFFKDKALYERFLNEADMDILYIEGIFGDPWGVPYSESDWKRSVDLVIWLQEYFLNDPSKEVILRSTSAYNVPTTYDEASEFIFSSCLLGTSVNERNIISPMFNMESPYTQSLYQVELGMPIETYHVLEGTHVYEREYSNVRVLVNPTSTTYTVDLGGSYQRVNGATVSSITLKGYTAAILIKP
jgi:hypothetical protein